MAARARVGDRRADLAARSSRRERLELARESRRRERLDARGSVFEDLELFLEEADADFREVDFTGFFWVDFEVFACAPFFFAGAGAFLADRFGSADLRRWAPAGDAGTSASVKRNTNAMRNEYFIDLV